MEGLILSIDSLSTISKLLLLEEIKLNSSVATSDGLSSNSGKTHSSVSSLDELDG